MFAVTCAKLMSMVQVSKMQRHSVSECYDLFWLRIRLQAAGARACVFCPSNLHLELPRCWRREWEDRLGGHSGLGSSTECFLFLFVLSPHCSLEQYDSLTLVFV